MGIYRVLYEVRESGAIDVWWPREFTITAETHQDATREAMKLAHDVGLETRFPLLSQQIETRQ